MTTLCGTDGKVYQIDRDIRAGMRQARVRVEVRLGETTAGQFQHAACRAMPTNSRNCAVRSLFPACRCSQPSRMVEGSPAGGYLNAAARPRPEKRRCRSV